jgi:pyruvate kinase
MALMWSAHSVHSEVVHSCEEMVSLAEATVRSEEFARPGELVVVVAGIPFGQSGSTNNLRVIRIGG